ncbi:DNA polymerase Y family protein [uncultured Sphingomonas sp.]|uniref:Y-family DNA polymerase n=1 Tax=uncultured Sphingomonas sp. TaxID=158754 RepID=UPI0035C96560
MKRVASLYLPEWPLDRLRRAGRIPSPTRTRPPRPVDPSVDSLDRAASARHQGGNPGWRPGAKWAKSEVEAEIAQLPLHQRPPRHELGRRSEAADHPFKAHSFNATPADEARPPVPGPSAVLSVRWNGEAGRAPGTRRAGDGPYPGEGAFFLTGRMTGDVVGRACKESPAPSGPRVAASEPPLVTAHRVDGRDVVHAANEAARALGVVPGMWLTQARALVAGLFTLPADPEGDRAALHRLAVAIARRWAPTAMVSDETGLFIDLTGVAHLHGGEANFGRRLGRLLGRLGYCSRIGIADTPGAAWAFARHLRQHPLTLCEPGRHAEALGPLPADALRLQPKHLELLRRLGVDTVGELAKLPRAPLARRFGGALVRRLDQATGRAPEPLEPVAAPERIVVEERYPEPIASAEVIEHRLGELASRLTTILEQAGVGARSLLLVADRVDGRAQTLRVGLSRPDRRPDHLLRLLKRRIEEIDPGYGIDALALHVARTEPLGPETLGPALAGDTVPDLAPLIDLLVNRLGGTTPWRVRPIESDVPERSTAPCPPLDPPDRPPSALKQGDVRRLDDREADHPWHPRRPRPVHLLARPEMLDFVIAEVPDHPPARFTWRGEVHRVVRADGPERIVGEWWRRTCERDAVRDYFSVEDEIGHRFWLFRRGDGVRNETGDLSWHLHGFHA